MYKILVVDDAAFMRNLCKDTLRKYGNFDYFEGENGEQAFEQYKKVQPDLVFLDITMPVKNGIDATKDIISYDPNAIIILIYALGQVPLAKQGLANGAKDAIIKPYKQTVFKSILQEYLKIF